MNMQEELSKLYKEVIRIAESHLSLKDDDRMISFKHNLKNAIINLGKVYYEESIRIALDCIDVKGDGE